MILQYTLLAVLGVISFIVVIGVVGVVRGEPMFIFKQDEPEPEEDDED